MILAAVWQVSIGAAAGGVISTFKHPSPTSSAIFPRCTRASPTLSSKSHSSQDANPELKRLNLKGVGSDISEKSAIPEALRAEPGRPVPHMGWNQLCALHEDPLLEGIAPQDYVYFIHSYAVPVSSNTLATAHYGEPLSAIVRRRNFWGTQFHPERSAATGARLLANFLRLG